MKKLFLLLISIFIFTGCGMIGNTPTSEVESFLSSYQKQDTKVIKQLEDVINSNSSFTDKQKESYKDVMKRQYNNLTYKIKDETIDGDTATVEVEIEVYDYYKAMMEADNDIIDNNQDFLDDEGNIDDVKFMDYKIDKIKNVKDKVTYTLNLTLTKHDKNWKMDDITDTDREKIHGTYKY